MAAVALAAPGCGSKEQAFSLASVVKNAEDESARGEIAMTIDAPEGKMQMDGGYVSSRDGRNGLMDVQINLEGGPPLKMKIRIIGNDVWVTGPEIVKELPRGKRWMHSTEGSDSVQSMSPSDFVRFLRGADEVEKVGEEEAAGRPATHYRGVLSLKKLTKAVGESGVKDFEMLGLKGQRVALDVWVDDDDLPARIRMGLPDGAKDGFRMDLTMEEYGVEVDVEPPAAGTVIEESEVG